MNEGSLKQIFKKLEDHEMRIRSLEGKKEEHIDNPPSSSTKEVTLAEVIRGKNLKSGQERVAVVVGYYEKITKKTEINTEDIKKGWVQGKLKGKFRTNLLDRAVSDGLVRDLENGKFDLSQTGEDFFEKLISSK